MDELTKTNVDAFDKSIEIYKPTYDGTRELAGHLVTRSYESESGRAKRLDYLPVGSEKSFSLGVTTRVTRLLDPWQVSEPFINRGFEPKILKITHGGTDMFGLFANDEYTYDFGEENPLVLSFGVWHRTHPGKATIVRGGFFRFICTNGLVSAILELGFLKVNHARIAVSEIESLVSGVSREFVANGYGDLAFPSKGLAKTINVINNTTNSDDLVDLPEILVNALKFFISRTPKFRESMLSNLDKLMTMTNKPTRLQVVNAVTNVGLEYGNIEDRPADLYWSLNPTISNLYNIAHMAEFFA